METKQTQQTQTPAGPEMKFSAGNISATVWMNLRHINGQEVPMRTVSLQKSYKDKEGSWKHTTTLHANDLPKAKLVLEKAYEHLAMTPVAME